MAQQSKLVRTQLANGKAVIASGETHAKAISIEAAKRITRQTPEQIEASILALVGYLSDMNGALSTAEDQYVAERADDVPLRDARDQANTPLLELAVLVRSRVEQVYGPTGIARYGFDGDTPRRPNDLAVHVANAIKLLRNDPQEKTDGLGARVSTIVMADTLDTLLSPLQDRIQALVVDARENEAALTARDRVSVEWQRAYRTVATGLAAYYTAAGRDDLADRIRPTIRRETGHEDTPPEPDPNAS